MKARGAAKLSSAAKFRAQSLPSSKALQKELFLGNLDAKRDWGYAPEYVEGMWRIVQLGEGDDFVLATGETHTVREFVEAAFAHADLDWKQFVKHDPRYERPAEVDLLLGDASKAKKILDWEPKVRIPRARAHHGRRGHGFAFAQHSEKTPRQTAVRCRCPINTVALARC